MALLENEVEVGGAYAEHEHIPLDRTNLLDAFLSLSDTIGLWKRTVWTSPGERAA